MQYVYVTILIFPHCLPSPFIRNIIFAPVCESSKTTFHTKSKAQPIQWHTFGQNFFFWKTPRVATSDLDNLTYYKNKEKILIWNQKAIKFAQLTKSLEQISS